MGLLQNPPELGAAFFFRLHPNNDPIQFEIAIADNENLSRRIALAYRAARCDYRNIKFRKSKRQTILLSREMKLLSREVESRPRAIIALSIIRTHIYLPPDKGAENDTGGNLVTLYIIAINYGAAITARYVVARETA